LALLAAFVSASLKAAMCSANTWSGGVGLGKAGLFSRASLQVEV